MARTGSCHLKKVSRGLKGDVMGSGKNWFLPLFLIRCVSVSSGKNWFLPLEVLGSYGEWQELVLATWPFDMWQDPVLATLLFDIWQEPVLAILRGVSEGLNCNVMGSGKNQFLPLFSLRCVSVSSGKNWFLLFKKGLKWAGR